MIIQLIVASILLQPQIQPLEIEGGYTSFQIGQLIKLKANGPSNTRFTWKLFPEIEGFHITPNKRQLILTSTHSTQILVILSSSVPNHDPIIHIKTLNIGLPSQITPMLPPLINRIQAIPSQSEAQILAQVFKQVAAMMAAGSVTTPNQVTKTTASLSRKQLAQNFDNWNEWFINLGNGLDEVKPQSIQQYQALWLQIANFLER